MIAQLRAENEALRKQLQRAEARPAQHVDRQKFMGLSILKPAEIRYDAEGILTAWSPEAERLLGWKSEDVVGRPFWEVLTPPEIPPEIVQLTLRFTLTGQLVTARSLTLMADGRTIECTYTNTVLCDPRGEPLEVSVEVMDVSQDSPAATLQRSRAFLVALLTNSPSVIYVKDTAFRYLLANHHFLGLFGFDEAQLLGHDDHELFPPEIATAFRYADEIALAGGEPLQVEERAITLEGERTFLSSKFALRSSTGDLIGICGISTDITASKRAEAERLALQEQVIEAQRLALRELSTPLMPIAEGVLAMPLVGAIDSARANEILETLLEGVVREQARTAILDITGVRVVDTQIANALVTIARAVKLLGAEVLLTGMSPAVAQTLVTLDLDLKDLTTLGTLQSGITHALRGPRRSGAPQLRR
ncbi:PAS domain-containing protein [Chondromyces apiculatus]|uniref:PAS domain-containing protein n=1 Tax=Chondromyces apiculatus TaxID=51 RepID=UPI001E2C5D0C|nr:PAS domain-containing protein [Chondromyces apiculatus]